MYSIMIFDDLGKVAKDIKLQEFWKIRIDFKLGFNSNSEEVSMVYSINK